MCASNRWNSASSISLFPMGSNLGGCIFGLACATVRAVMVSELHLPLFEAFLPICLSLASLLLPISFHLTPFLFPLLLLLTTLVLPWFVVSVSSLHLHLGLLGHKLEQCVSRCLGVHSVESSEVCSRSAGEYVLSLAPFARFLLPQAVATELLLFSRPRVLAALLYASRTGGLWGSAASPCDTMIVNLAH